MKVLKFGGTSVGTAESLENVRQIVESISEPAVIVVSALGGLTDNLITTAYLAAEGSDYIENVEKIVKRHEDIIQAVVTENSRGKCLDAVAPLFNELQRLYDGVSLIRDLPEKTLDHIVSFGERISSIIVSMMFTDATHINSLEIIKTEKWFGKNIAAKSLTEANIINNIKPESGKPVVAGGFISTDAETGEVTNLGRGGSDFTAALIAAALNADILEIWTDVDGFMTSDPRIIKDALIIPEMSFVESMELCSFGAKVIYPPTIYPVFHKNIPIKILNTFNPTAPGTMIRDYESLNYKNLGRIRGMSVLRDICVFNLEGEYAKDVATINNRAFNALAKNGIGVFLVSPDGDNSRFSFALKEIDKEKAQRILEDEFAPEMSAKTLSSIFSISNLAIIAIVGHNITSGVPISPRIYNTFMRNNITPIAYAEGPSKTTVTFVVESSNANRALELAHSLFYN